MLDREGAKAPQFHAFAAGQRLDDFIEHDVDDPLDVAVIEVLIGSGNLLNELRLDHWFGLPSPQQLPTKVFELPHLSEPCQTDTRPSSRNRPSATFPSTRWPMASAARPPMMRLNADIDRPATPQPLSDLRLKSTTFRPFPTPRSSCHDLPARG